MLTVTAGDLVFVLPFCLEVVAALGVLYFDPAFITTTQIFALVPGHDAPPSETLSPSIYVCENYAELPVTQRVNSFTRWRLKNLLFLAGGS